MLSRIDTSMSRNSSGADRQPTGSVARDDNRSRCNGSQAGFGSVDRTIDTASRGIVNERVKAVPPGFSHVDDFGEEREVEIALFASAPSRSEYPVVVRLSPSICPLRMDRARKLIITGDMKTILSDVDGV